MEATDELGSSKNTETNILRGIPSFMVPKQNHSNFCIEIATYKTKYMVYTAIDQH